MTPRRPVSRTIALAAGALVATLAWAAPYAQARPSERVGTSRAVCSHGTQATWRVAYETFAAATFHDLGGPVTHQASPGRGRPSARLTTALRQSADQFAVDSHCTVGLRFDVYWGRSRTLVVHQEPYARLRASLLPLPTPAGGPRTGSQFFSRYDSVMEQFSATKPDGEPRLGFDFLGETFGYVSLIDDPAPPSWLINQELLQGMVRFFTTRGVRIAPNPETGVDAYCSALRRLHYTDIHRVSSSTCISRQYVRDVIAGTIPIYHGIGRGAWRRYSVSRSWRRHRTIPAGLPVGHGRISSGADVG